METNRGLQQDGHPAGSTLMAALDRELPPRQHSAVEEHLAKCPQCAAQWERLQQVSGRLTEFHRSIPSRPEFELKLPPDERPPSVLSGILSFFLRPQFFMPAAAVATALIGVILWTSSRAGVTHVAGAVPATSKEPVEARTIGVSKPAVTPAPPPQTAMIPLPRRLRATARSQQAGVQRHAPNPEPDASTSQTAEVFWYLPYSDPALAAEGAEVVRADLPREAFLMAGVPLANIPAGGPKERIAADIVIGADGLPRAIRPARPQTTDTVIPTRL